MSNGVVTQIIGAVIDVEFDRENIPSVYEALNIVGLETVLEVQQQLGDGIVRTIAGFNRRTKKRFRGCKNECTYFCSCWTRNSGKNYGCFGKSHR